MKDKMTWEETIQYIRTKPEYKLLVEKAYFEEELSLNVERFKESEEFLETLKLIKLYAPNAKNILDVGSGNGISAVAFALNGHKVLSTEPDPSLTIGAGAIRKLKLHYNLESLEVVEEFAENISTEGVFFDIIYVRQAMHHANDLNQFIINLSKLLKPGGILLTVRDHVIIDEVDKKLFLETHPLQKFYGGENAFTENEYLFAFKNAGLKILKRLKHFESVINYFPISVSDYNEKILQGEKNIKNSLYKKIGILSNLNFLLNLYKRKNNFSETSIFDENKIPGRMYTFVTQKD
jgi:SAM-dependent methyltransferase